MPDNALPLPGTEPPMLEGDLTAQMVAGLNRFLMRELADSRDRRAALWQRNNGIVTDRTDVSV